MGKEDKASAAEKKKAVTEEEFSEDEVVTATMEALEYKAEAVQVKKKHELEVKNVSRHHTLALRIKCTDGERFVVKANGSLVLKHGDRIGLDVVREPHKQDRDERISIHYTRWPKNRNAPSETHYTPHSLRQLFRSRSTPHISILLRVPQHALNETPATGDPASDLVVVQKEKDDNAMALILPHGYRPLPSSAPRGLLRRTPPPHPPNKPGQRSAPTPLRVDDFRDCPLIDQSIKLKLLLFPAPSSNKHTTITFRAWNPSSSRRVAVKIMSNLSPEGFTIRPTQDIFLRPDADFAITLTRLEEVNIISASGGYILLKAVMVRKREMDWAKVWREAKPEEVSTTEVEVECRNQPYLQVMDSLHPRFFLPHSHRSLAALTVTNISPFAAAAELFLEGPPREALLHPACALIRPGQQQQLLFGLCGERLGAPTRKWVLRFVKLKSEDEKKLASMTPFQLRDVVRRVVQGIPLAYQMTGDLGMCDKAALSLDQDSLTLSRDQKTSSQHGAQPAVSERGSQEQEAGVADKVPELTGSLTLRNISSARLAVQARTSSPHLETVLDSSLLEGEAAEEYARTTELRLTLKADKAIHSDLILFIDTAFVLSEDPARVGAHLFRNPAAVHTLRVPITLQPASSSPPNLSNKPSPNDQSTRSTDE